MWKVLVPLCAAGLLASLPARSAVDEDTGADRRAGLAATSGAVKNPQGGPQPGLRWFLGVGGVSLLATVRTRTLLRCRRQRLQEVAMHQRV